MEVKSHIRNEESENIEMTKQSFIVNRSRKIQTMIYIPLIDIFDERKKLLKDDSLTIILFLSFRYESSTAELPQPSKLFNSNTLSDFKIKCNDRDIPAHRAILYEKCDVFARMLDAPMEEAMTNEVIIDEIEGEVILQLIRFIYTGSVENLEETALELLEAAEKYQLPKLKLECVKACSKIMEKSNVFKMLVLADRYGEDILMQNCVSYIRL